MTEKKIPITVARGDGIGPEIMEACLNILLASGAELAIEEVEIGEKLYLQGHPTGIEDSTWESIRRTGVFYKAPITTPQGGGFKSLNVTVRTMLGLYANVRPCVAYAPFVKTKHPGMDVVIIRENEEDLYTGIEYQQTADTVQALKIITRPGCERIVRYAFEYARAFGRKKVTCFTKDNILKMSDGLFHKVFQEIASEYPDLENEHWIIDIGAAKLADTPENFDVVVMPNLYGDILSDVAAQIAGSVGLAGSANIGPHAAMFEAIHGSAPRRAGQNLANPSGLLLGGVMMLAHIGCSEAAEQVHNAWLKTVEDGIHTYDIFKEGISKVKVGTQEFGQAVIERLGQKPSQLKAMSYANAPKQKTSMVAPQTNERKPSKKQLVGVDVFVDSQDSLEKLQEVVARTNGSALQLTLITSRGARVWPGAMPETSHVDQWRCRYLAQDENNDSLSASDVIELLSNLNELGVDVTKMEQLYSFDGVHAYSLAQQKNPQNS